MSKKEILNGYKFIIPIGYCQAQDLLGYQRAKYYTYSRVYGWRADIYEISEDVAIVTGYAPFGNISVDYTALKDYNLKALNAYLNVRNEEKRKELINGYLKEFINQVIGGKKWKKN